MAGLGALGIASGLAVNSFTSTADAAPATATATATPAPHSGPVVAHLADARTGAVDLFIGERQLRVHDPALASALAHAATLGS
ncbi:hypothetical protein [Amycolatopsis sp. PS_44_ISF1]|uniref:hypothetical protein n=1 Tax=Amycolatopsis sp. PS_44_ISF1 TaxID=2974917 RepID=UPI0028DE9B85|nr:hypothetical protein [Amycolatopsis sp. PS_44_ISF1]MDT8912029.1 hypothetical protein [Amycolatopsis sp. PS_44_ISF1]